MRKLLNADFSRLWNDKSFLLILLATLLLSAYMPTTWNLSYGDTKTCVDSVLFQLIPYIPFLCTLTAGLFWGEEFEANAIRNKLIVGHTRREVYFSAYFTTAAASLLLLAALLLGAGGSGWIRFRELRMPWGQLAWLTLCCVLFTLFFSAVSVAFVLNIPRKPTIFLTLFFLVLLYTASYLGARLSQEEMTYSGVTITAEGGIEFGDLLPNPAYVSGTKRTVFAFFYDLLPTGQAIQLNNSEFDRCARWPVLSAFVLAVSTLLGYLPFRKRDIR